MGTFCCHHVFEIVPSFGIAVFDNSGRCFCFRFFPILSADNEKVGELQVSLVLESLMGMLRVVSKTWKTGNAKIFQRQIIVSQKMVWKIDTISVELLLQLRMTACLPCPLRT